MKRGGEKEGTERQKGGKKGEKEEENRQSKLDNNAHKPTWLDKQTGVNLENDQIN